MLALHLELLTGRYVATSFDDRGRAEWPPHPARVFSALVATWGTADPPDAAEAAALRWLEALPPPSLVVGEAARRDVVTVFVPVNDVSVTNVSDEDAEGVAFAEVEAAARRAEAAAATDAGERKRLDKELKALDAAAKKAREAFARQIRKEMEPYEKEPPDGPVRVAAELVSDQRKKQPRTFPSVTPDEPRITLIWPDADAGAHLSVLDRIAARLHRVGHSASLVAARFDEAASAPTLVPVPRGRWMLRVPRAGQLDRLVQEREAHQETQPRVLPTAFAAYDEPSAVLVAGPSSCFDPSFLVLRRVGGPRLPASFAEDVARAVRGGLLANAGSHPGPLLSGHEASGAPLSRPHLAIVPLPFVGHQHADASILGVALVFPRDAADAERQEVYRALARWEAAHEDGVLPLRLGARGVLEVEREDAPRLSGLLSDTWSRPSRRWVTATPIALDRNPGRLDHRDAERAMAARGEAASTIAAACRHVGLPTPLEVSVMRHSRVSAAPWVDDFLPFPRDPSKGRRVLVHAELVFAEPVSGPVLLGAGRYVGLGVCRPVREEELPWTP